MGESGGGVAAAQAACSTAITSLRGSGIATEHLAEYVAPRRSFLRTRPATMRPLGEVWRIGPLLLDASAALYAVGKLTRAAERGRPNYQSVSREERRDLAAAALRGGYPVGTPVNFDATPLPLNTAALATLSGASPIGLVDGEVRVRWHAGAPLEGSPTLAVFLTERVQLLVDSPHSAND